MERLTYKGCEVEIYSGYNGDEIFITRGEEKVYSARVNRGEGKARMYRVLG